MPPNSSEREGDLACRSSDVILDVGFVQEDDRKEEESRRGGIRGFFQRKAQQQQQRKESLCIITEPASLSGHPLSSPDSSEGHIEDDDASVSSFQSAQMHHMEDDHSSSSNSYLDLEEVDVAFVRGMQSGISSSEVGIGASGQWDEQSTGESSNSKETAVKPIRASRSLSEAKATRSPRQPTPKAKMTGTDPGSRNASVGSNKCQAKPAKAVKGPGNLTTKKAKIPETLKSGPDTCRKACQSAPKRDRNATTTRADDKATVGNDQSKVATKKHEAGQGDRLERAATAYEQQIVPYDSSQKQQDTLSHKHARRPSASRSDLSSTSQSLHSLKPLDPEEEERRRRETDTAMEILEHMRRANLVMEFGPGVDLDACVFCLREQRQREMKKAFGKGSMTPPPPLKKKKHPLKDLLPNLLPKQKCLICHSPVCKNHWDHGFLHQQNVILCQDCAPLFDLDNLVECMHFSAARDIESQKAQQEQHMRRLLILYDRALLALRHSSQSFDDKARRQIMMTTWQKQQLGIGGHVTNIASGVTGIAATAVFMTPYGPWLLLTSLALGGIATAVGSGSFLIERLCPQTRQAEQTIALASMVDSLLEATTILRQARITGALPRPDESEHDDDDDDDDDVAEIKRIAAAGRPPMLEASEEQMNTMYLQEDKEQRLMITILKAKKDREERPKNPVHFVMQRIQKHNKEKEEEQNRIRKQHRRFNTDDRLDAMIDECDEEEQRGPLKRVACRFRRELHRAKDQADSAVAVARTATALAAVGMQAGGGGVIRRLTSRGRSTHQKTTPKRSNGEAETAEDNQKDGDAEDKKANEKQVTRHSPFYVVESAKFAAQRGLRVFAVSFFDVAQEENQKEEATKKDGSDDENDPRSDEKQQRTSIIIREPTTMPDLRNLRFPFGDILIRVFVRTNAPTPDDPNAQERALVAEIRHNNMDLKLRASERIMKKFTRTNFKVAKEQGLKDRRKRLLATEESDANQGSAVERIFVKNARFLIKASLTVLRETARYAGGAFSAAIVCVETMELKEKVDRMRANGSDGVQCANADKLDKLKHHLWENQTSFPDTMTLEWELFANPNGEIEEITHVDGEATIPHWSSSYEGERPDGSCANLPIMEDSLATLYEETI